MVSSSEYFFLKMEAMEEFPIFLESVMIPRYVNWRNIVFILSPTVRSLSVIFTPLVANTV